MNAFLVRAAAWVCALPIGAVVETMRALPLREVAGAPRFVLGLSVIRGGLVPVVSLAALLGEDEDAGRAPGGRLVSIRTGERSLALAVDDVLGVRRLDPARFAETPPLLTRALPQCVEHIAALDGAALAVIEAARLVPEELWASVEGAP